MALPHLAWDGWERGLHDLTPGITPAPNFEGGWGEGGQITDIIERGGNFMFLAANWPREFSRHKENEQKIGCSHWLSLLHRETETEREIEGGGVKVFFLSSMWLLLALGLSCGIASAL